MKRYSTLKDYTNEELLEYLENNTTTELGCLSGLLSEILRRMNEISPLLPLNQKNLFSEWEGALHCRTSDGRIVNCAEELNRLETENEQTDWANPLTP